MVLLIGGHMRSGTGLLRNLCNLHPEMAITNEFKYFSGLGKPYAEHSRQLLNRLWHETTKRRMRRISFAKHLRNYAFVARYLFEMHRYRKNLVDVTAIESTLRSIFPGARIVGDKTPSYVLSLDELALINGLCCLIIFRDCRDVTSSMLDMARRKGSKKALSEPLQIVKSVSKSWVNSIELMERHKDKIYIVRYEDLVQQPSEELERLAKWLGVDTAGFLEKMIRDTSIGKYKTGLTDKELKTVMEIAGPTMARLGYI